MSLGRCISRNADEERHPVHSCYTASVVTGLSVIVQEEEEKRRLQAELREFDSRLERSERSNKTTY